MLHQNNQTVQSTIDNYSVKQVTVFTVGRLMDVERILYASGKHIAENEGLHHWDNSRLKTFVIVVLCVLKNKVYLVFDGKKAVATFQTQIKEGVLIPQKLAIIPSLIGCGLGSFCWQRIEQEAANRGCKAIRSYVYDKNKNAISFHTHKGYRIVGETKTLKYTEIIMERTLE